MSKDLFQDIEAVLKQHGYHSQMFKFAGQETIEQKILERKKNPASYDPKTYGDPKIFAEFEERGKDLKFVFLNISSARKNWGINLPDLIREYDVGNFSFPDRCPDTGVLLDPGFGRNSVTELPEFKPSFEHIITRKEINDKGLGIEYNDISNLEIISSAANTYRNKGVFEHRAQLFFSELMRKNK
jgi:hypothetical protein